MPLWFASILTVATVGGILFALHRWLGRYDPDPMQQEIGDVPNPRGRG